MPCMAVVVLEVNKLYGSFLTRQELLAWCNCIIRTWPSWSIAQDLVHFVP